LIYTAKSIPVNDPDHVLGDVYLAWVSDRPSSQYQGQLDQIKNSITGRKVTLIDFQPMMSASNVGGWHAQQIVKLKMASVVGSDYYVIMDSKNTLIRKIVPQMFFTECNVARIQAEFEASKIPVPHSDWYRRSANALGLGPPSTGNWPASITPILLHKKTTLDMLAHLNEPSSIQTLCAGPRPGDLCDKMGARSISGHGATEFTMYTLWAYSRPNLKSIHFVEPMANFKISYGHGWHSAMAYHLTRTGFVATTLMEQVTVSSHQWPIEWTPEKMVGMPTQDQFPLKFEDLTRKWAASLWRGEASNAKLLEAVNLVTLTDVDAGKRQFPLMFGAQPASLNSPPMDPTKRAQAVDLLVNIYKKAGLWSGGDPEELVRCVVGLHN
jgi:hypothetical protein